MTAKARLGGMAVVNRRSVTCRIMIMRLDEYGAVYDQSLRGHIHRRSDLHLHLKSQQQHGSSLAALTPSLPFITIIVSCSYLPFTPPCLGNSEKVRLQAPWNMRVSLLFTCRIQGQQREWSHLQICHSHTLSTYDTETTSWI